jgi:hypothetical protein
MSVNPNDPLSIILNLINTKGSNKTDINNLFDPNLAFATGSAVDTGLTDAQIEQLNMPTWLSLANTPSDSIPSKIAADIANGIDPFTVKQNIRKSGVQLLPGETFKTYDDLVDKLVSEQTKTTAEKLKRDTAADIYTKAGIPNPNERFDPTNVYPDLFAGMQKGINETQAKVDKSVGDVYAQNPTTQRVTDKNAQLELLKKQVLKEWSTPAEGQNFDKPWQDQTVSYAGAPAYTLGDILKNANISWSDPLAINSLLKGVTQVGGGVLKDIFMPSSSAKDKKAMEKAAMKEAQARLAANPNQILQDPVKNAQAAARANYLAELAGAPAKTIGDNPLAAAAQGQVWDAKLKAFRAPAAGEFGTTATRVPALNLRDPVAKQNAIMALTSQLIGKGMEQQGQTPANVELLKRAIALRTMGK